nr:sterol carrier protein domain-containing protein [Nocardioides perillae]
MLRVHDLVEAVRARALTGLPVPDAAVALEVAGDRLGTLDGGYALRVVDGAVACERADARAGALRLTPQGLALLWAGAWSVGALRDAGLAAGGDEADDALLDAVWSAGARGAALHVRDYF